MRILYILIFLAICLVPGVVPAQTPIHKCTNADGVVVYSQLPCKDEGPAEPEIPADIEIPAELELPASLDAADSRKVERESSADRQACKKRYRDEIDAIDAEIQREYSKEKDSDYKQRLLALTRKLRDC